MDHENEPRHILLIKVTVVLAPKMGEVEWGRRAPVGGCVELMKKARGGGLDPALARASAAPLVLLLDDVAEPGRVVVAGHLLDLLPAGRRVARARVVRGRGVLGLLLL